MVKLILSKDLQIFCIELSKVKSAHVKNYVLDHEWERLFVYVSQLSEATSGFQTLTFLPCIKENMHERQNDDVIVAMTTKM